MKNTSSSKGENSVLIVDDDPVILDSLSGYLRLEEWNVDCAGSGEEALRMIEKGNFFFVIADINMHGLNGIDLLRRIKSSKPETEVIMMTGNSSEENTIQALRAGATDYFRKPIQGSEVSASLMRARRVMTLKTRNSSLSALVSRFSKHSEGYLLIGKSPAASHLMSQLEKVAALPETTVLLTGESGSGKEVAARAIHRLTPGQEGNFVAINCGGISESLLERELFGHEKGSFTGADKRSPGVFEMALGGTVLLDEIGEMTISGQSRLLRVLEERSFRRVGGSVEVKLSGTRIIAASNKDLEQLVEEKKLREDLYFRLNVVPVRVPALRERREDIPLLAAHYLEVSPAGEGKAFDPEALVLLQNYSFPGNIRELKNMVEKAAVFCSEGMIYPSDLSFSGLARRPEVSVPRPGLPQIGSKNFNLDEAERLIIEAAIKHHGGNRAATARALGVTPQSLYRRLAKYNLT